MKSSPRPRRLRLFAPAGVLAASLGLGLLVPVVSPAAPLDALERQLALAIEAREPGSVRELAHRITALDASATRQLRLAETFLDLGLFADLDGALDRAVATSPVPLRVIDKFRAESAAAQGEWADALIRWEAYVRSPVGLPPAERVAALDEFVQALVHEHAWQNARERLDQRLALADAADARLLRATVNVRTRHWQAAREDFQHLQRIAPDHAEVKPFLPRWERVERVLPELMACDEALDAAPTALAPRVTRGLASLRAGLWQNAAEDLAAARHDWPMTRAPELLLTELGVTFATHEQEPDFDSLPLLAASDTVLSRNEQLEFQPNAWQALRECDARIAATPDRWTLPPLRAEQARLEGALGFQSRALDDARDILRDFPEYLPAQRVEIAALLAFQRWVEADARVAVALQRHNGPNDIADVELRRLAALVWQGNGKHQAAVDMFTTLLRSQRTVALLRARARSLRFLQRFAEASDDLAAAENLEAASAEKTP